MGKKIVGISIDQNVVEKGDLARRQNSELDSRLVSRIADNQLYLEIMGEEMGPFRADRYEFVRLVEVGENATALAVPCLACNAKAGKPCTQPTDTGRRQVSWFHLSRSETVT